MTKGRKFLSDLKLYSDFLGWRDELGRYETWEEAVEDVFETHRVRYAKHMDQLHPYMREAVEAYKEMRFLAAQRNLQFRGTDIFKHNFRMYNCLVMFSDKPSFLGNAFYLLLCGCGVGVNMMLPFVDRLPRLSPRTKGTKTYVIQDSVEGWADASHAFISSYISDDYPAIEGFEQYQGYEIKFDYSPIRVKGARLGRRFIAPGPEGLKNAFEKIEEMMNKSVRTVNQKFTSVLAYEFFMHLSDAVLSGGVRRAACSIICSPEDRDLVFAKSGNWRERNKQRERSNNSVGLIRGQFSYEEFENLLKLNQGTSDIGFVFMNNIFEVFNPCFEIGFTPLHFDYENQELVKRIMASDISVLDEGVTTAIQCCNLNEVNGAMCKTKDDARRAVRAATITGTLQAGYTDFKHIKDNLLETIVVSRKEALLGISITGWMLQPWLFDAEFLQELAQIVVDVNEEVAEIIGINPSARSTTVKPGGNSGVILGVPGGLRGEHSPNYFRIMQLNKQTEVAKWLEANMPFILEQSGQKDNDWVIFAPIENEEGTIYQDQLLGVKHLELIKLVKENWVDASKVKSRCIIPTTSHNVSNTVIIDDYEQIAQYIFDHQDVFTAVSFMGQFGDKDYHQSPNTSVLSASQLLERYGDGMVMASGLIVDGLHAFDDNLWRACQVVEDKSIKLEGSRTQQFLQREWIRRAKKFARNYFRGDVQRMLYCLKDVHLYHKWHTINRQMREVDFTKILTRPEYVDISNFAGAECSGGVCEISRI
jgi:ribonucleoside-triphosphate reductase